MPDTRVDEVLDLVGLDARSPGAGSAGSRSACGSGSRSASALIGDPGVLVLDEPFNGLDPDGIATHARLPAPFADDGGTVFLSSHLLAEVAHSADDAVVIDHGRLVTAGPVAELVPAGGSWSPRSTPWSTHRRRGSAAARVPVRRPRLVIRHRNVFQQRHVFREVTVMSSTSAVTAAPLRRQVGIELFKLRTTPAVYVSLAISVSLAVVSAVTAILLAGTNGTPALGTVDNVVKTLSVSALTSMVMLVLGILVSAGEYRTARGQHVPR